LGVITFAAAESARRFEAADLALAEEVARRCALAVDNARLYQSERAAREEAEQATRLRDEFLSIASHELRTPVTSLRGYAQLVLRRLSRTELPDRAELSRALEIIDQQADRLARLVTQLLDLSRLEAGRLTLDRAEADIAALAQQVVDGARATTDRHQFVVRADGPVRAEVDPLRLEQVLINLVDNAVRYSPDGGEIEVEIGSNGRESPAVRIAVRDHGVGIAPEHLPYVFDRYYQAHQLGRFGGMGLGLHIAKQIVEQHGGRIEAERPPDGGSRFVVTLPLTE